MAPVVVCVRVDTALEQVSALLEEHHECALPVVDAAGNLLGLVSKLDVMRCWRARPKDPGAIKASAVMTPAVHSLPEQAPLSFAIALMASEGVRQVPIVSDAGPVVGIIAASDALKWLATRLGYTFAAAPRSSP